MAVGTSQPLEQRDCLTRGRLTPIQSSGEAQGTCRRQPGAGVSQSARASAGRARERGGAGGRRPHRICMHTAQAEGGSARLRLTGCRPPGHLGQGGAPLSQTCCRNRCRGRGRAVPCLGARALAAAAAGSRLRNGWRAAGGRRASSCGDAQRRQSAAGGCKQAQHAQPPPAPTRASARTRVEAAHAGRRDGVPARARRQAVPRRRAHAAAHAPRAKDGVARAHVHAAAAVRPRLQQACKQWCSSSRGGSSRRAGWAGEQAAGARGVLALLPRPCRAAPSDAARQQQQQHAHPAGPGRRRSRAGAPPAAPHRPPRCQPAHQEDGSTPLRWRLANERRQRRWHRLESGDGKAAPGAHGGAAAGCASLAAARRAVASAAPAAAPRAPRGSRSGSASAPRSARPLPLAEAASPWRAPAAAAAVLLPAPPAARMPANRFLLGARSGLASNSAGWAHGPCPCTKQKANAELHGALARPLPHPARCCLHKPSTRLSSPTSPATSL